MCEKKAEINPLGSTRAAIDPIISPVSFVNSKQQKLFLSFPCRQETIDHRGRFRDVCMWTPRQIPGDCLVLRIRIEHRRRVRRARLP